MKNLIITIILGLLIFSCAQNKKSSSQNAQQQGPLPIHHLDWDGIEVVWLEDDRFPTYHMIVHFSDGALSDDPARLGETQAMFNMLSTGTRRYSRSELVENLEFYGVSYGPNVTHEYSTYSVSGLVKDMIPAAKKVCHLFQDATFPKKEIVKDLKQAIDAAKNLVSNHSSLASIVFREVSMRGSGYENPVSGKIKTLKKLSSEGLRKKLEYFNKEVKKKIYIAGPKDVKNLKNVVLNDCGWTRMAAFQRDRIEISFKDSDPKRPAVFLVPVPGANQAQVRIGRYLGGDEIGQPERMSLLSEVLGGGFTSLLIKKLRVDLGLTYSAAAFAAGQRDYGRAAVTTFTKNQTLEKLILNTKNILFDLNQGKLQESNFRRARSGLAGSHPFRFEDTGSFLSELQFLDHIGRPYSHLQEFPSKVKALEKSEVIETSKNIFEWSKQSIVVVGSKDLEKQLSLFGEVKILNYKDFL